jgi:hypothetical protein
LCGLYFDINIQYMMIAVLDYYGFSGWPQSGQIYILHICTEKKSSVGIPQYRMPT